LALHQQAADELGGNQLSGAAEESLGEVLGGRGGYGSGCGRLCWRVLTAAAGGAKLEEQTPHRAISEEQLAVLLAKLKEDAGLQEKLQIAADLDAAVALAKEAGFDVSRVDWLKYQAQQTLELSDEELEGVAGGFVTMAGCQSQSGYCAGSDGCLVLTNHVRCG
jgi:predicted ribosomally synthesized peptide with nif11-like leader